MRVSTRIIFTLYIIVVVLLCLFLLGSMYGLFSSDNLLLAVMTFIGGAIQYKILYTIIFAAMAVIGVVLIFCATKKKKGTTAVLNSSEGGQVLISKHAVEQLTKNYLSRFDSVKEEKSFIGLKDGGVDMLLKIQTLPDVDIPDITTTLQNGLSEYITKHSGLKVNAVKILVTSVNEPMITNPDGGQQ